MTSLLDAGRIRRRNEIITLALSRPETERSAQSFAPDPELTEMDIWLRRLGSAHDGLRVVHLTDIHLSLFTPLGEVQRAVQLANELRADVIALTGDYVTFSSGYIHPVARALGRLRARLGVFAVLGNHDFRVDAEGIARALREQGIQVLRNASFALRAGSGTLWVVGVDDLWSGADDLEAATRHVPTRDPKLLLCHNPMGIRRAATHGIDFVLSGHTHGGQVCLPLVGSVHGRSKLGERFVDGWNRLKNTQIYVNRGIGKSVVPVRVNCPSEIACFRLRRPQHLRN